MRTGRGTVVPVRFNSTACSPMRNRRQIPPRQAPDQGYPPSGWPGGDNM